MILITGVTGTLGTELSRALAKEPNTKILGISRDEQKQRQVPEHPRIRLRLADVRDPLSIYRAIGPRKVDKIYHLAALKCVDTLEHQPDEALATNVIGTQNILDIAQDLGAKVIFTSTDKACYPVNAYGQSKALAEKMVLNRGHIVARYGNVLGSRGSFLPNLILSLKSEGKAYITDPYMTRFWMSVDQVTNFVIKAGELEGSGIKIPDGIQSCKITDFVDAVATFLGVSRYETETIGIRPGEKLYETLRTSEEGDILTSSDKAHRFDKKSLVRFISDVMKGDK